MMFILRAGTLVVAAVTAASAASAAPASAGAAQMVEKTLAAMVERSVVQVRNAFFRRQAVLDETTAERPAAPGHLSALVPAYGFVPPGETLTLALSALDTRRSQLCASLLAHSADAWRAAVKGFTRGGMSLASAQCQAVGSLALPSQWPATVSAVRVFDSEDVPLRTLLPAYPQISGPDPQALTRPSYTLAAAPGQWSAPAVITVYNPRIVLTETPLTYQATAVSSADIREGFSVEHTCQFLAADSTCTVSVRYQGVASEPYRVGSLRLTFATGEVAVIGVLGVRANP